MEGGLAQIIEEYKKTHPEFDEIMKNFHLSQEIYEKALVSMYGKVQQPAATYMLTTQGRYNVNISTAY